MKVEEYKVKIVSIIKYKRHLEKFLKIWKRLEVQEEAIAPLM